MADVRPRVLVRTSMRWGEVSPAALDQFLSRLEALYDEFPAMRRVRIAVEPLEGNAPA